MPYEGRHLPPIAPRHFARRVSLHFLGAAGVMAGSLGMGMAGYSYYEGLEWRDAFLNASMLLGGMGPVDPPHTPAGKVFAGCYALYAGLVFILAIGIMAAPLLHRLLHRFHFEEK